jgi:hypothetical protein
MRLGGCGHPQRWEGAWIIAIRAAGARKAHPSRIDF